MDMKTRKLVGWEIKNGHIETPTDRREDVGKDILWVVLLAIAVLALFSDW
jgi:hypothetical protein